MKKLFLGLSTLLALAPTSPREEVGYALEAETTLLRTFEARRSERPERLLFRVDGEVYHEVEDLEFEVESLERVVARDVIVEVEGGRPTDVRRTFVELLQESTQTSAEDETETRAGSDFEGLTVRFLWDDEDQIHVVELDDDESDIDEELVERLTHDMDLVFFLPEDEVEVGDSWEIDGRAYLTLMWPSGFVGWYGEDESEQSEAAMEFERDLVEHLEGQGTVTLEEIREEDGVRLALLVVELAVESWVTIELEDGREQRTEDQRELEGEILWDLDHGHLHAARFETELASARIETGPAITPQGDEVELEGSWEFVGSIEYVTTIERE